MLSLKGVFRDHNESRPFHTLVNVCAFVGPTTMLMKGAEVAVALSVRGPDAECLEPHHVAQITARVTSAYRIFGEDYVITSHWCKRSHPTLITETCEDSFVEELVRNRAEYLTKRSGQRFFYELYIVITRKSGWRGSNLGEKIRRFLTRTGAATREALSTVSCAEDLGRPLETSITALHRDVNSFIEQVRGDLIVTVLDKKQAFAFLRRLLNPDRAKADAVSLNHDMHVDYFLVDSELRCYRQHLEVGNFCLKLQTLKEPPAHTFGHMFRALFDIEAEMIVSTEWNPWSAARARKKAKSKQKHFHNTKRSVFSQVGAEHTSEMDTLLDQSKQAVERDLGQLMEEMEMEGLQIGEFSLTIVTITETLEAAERACAAVARVVAAHEGVVNEETYASLPVFLATLPGGYPFNLRKLLITIRNYVDMVLWFLPTEGERRSAFLNAPCLAVFETEDHGLFHYNLHVEDVSHTLVLGKTGAGKSFDLNFIIAHAQKYQPFTFILDLGGSYRCLTEALNGSCISVRPGNLPFSINVFALAPSPSNLAFQCHFPKLLIELLERPVSDEEEKELFDAVEALRLLPPEQRRLSTLANMVPRGIGKYLKRWTKGGQFGEYFDNIEDTVSYGRFQYIDYEGMQESGPVGEALLFYLIHRVNEIVIDPALATVPKLATVDEAWLFFKSPITCRYIEKGFKTWRKHNGGMILATQSLQDLAGSEILRPVVDNCATKIFLANPALDGELYGEVLRLTPMEQEKVRNLQPKRQFLLKREGLSKTLNLNVDPKSYWLFTTNPFEVKRRQELIDRVGLHEALEILSGESQ